MIKREEKGITLVALVITIIILVILASVTIVTTINQGIIGTAKKAADNYDKGSVYQALTTILLEEKSLYDNGFVSGEVVTNNIKDSIRERFGDDTEISDKTYGFTVKVGDYAFYIRTANELKVDDSIDADAIANNPSKYYGKKVQGYTATNSSVTGWEIFHSDGENIYLIADDYIPASAMPSKGEKAVNQVENSNYKVYFTDMISAYGTDSLTNIKNGLAAKWFSFDPDNGNAPKRANIKTTAYLLDTTAWSGFTGENAEYAIGAPTLDLFVASYNNRYREGQLTPEIGAQGYSWNGRFKKENLQNSVPYHISSTEKASGMWIASPSNHNSTFVITTSSGVIEDKEYSTTSVNVGLRPVICLKATAGLFEENGILTLI